MADRYLLNGCVAVAVSVPSFSFLPFAFLTFYFLLLFFFRDWPQIGIGLSDEKRAVGISINWVGGSPEFGSISYDNNSHCFFFMLLFAFISWYCEL